MKVRGVLFARRMELAGADSLEVEVPEGTRMGDLWCLVQGSCPPLATIASPPLMARDLEYVREDSPVMGGEEIAFLPPVSGG